MKDFLQLENGDLDLTSGDIVMGESTFQHQTDIILTAKGELKFNPTRGVGAEDFFNDESPEDLLRKTRQELIIDGMKLTKISELNGNINIEGYYEADYNG